MKRVYISVLFYQIRLIPGAHCGWICTVNPLDIKILKFYFSLVLHTFFKISSISFKYTPILAIAPVMPIHIGTSLKQ